MLEIPCGNFDAYLFDCDGTLADSMPIHYRAWSHALQAVNAPFTITEEYYFALGGIPTKAFVSYMNKEFGANLDVETTAAIKKQYYLDHAFEAKVIGPVADFVRKLPRKRVAVVSGGLRSMLLKTLSVIGFEDYFPVIVAAEDTVKGKPDPAPFLLAAEKLGVEPSKCLVFEDTPIGYQAATAAGMKYVAIDASKWRHL